MRHKAEKPVTTQKIGSTIYVRFKVTTSLYLKKKTNEQNKTKIGQEVCPRLLQSTLTKILKIVHSLL